MTTPAAADTLRIATYNADLSREGPGLLARDITQGSDRQVQAVVQVIAAARPDVLFIAEIDWDGDGTALAALQSALAAAGMPYDQAFALRPNTGLRTGLDLDGDGSTDGRRDAQGYGGFPGHRGMAILSRLAIDAGNARDFSAMLWRDLPHSQIADAALTPEAAAIQRLSTTGHWDVPVTLPDGRALHLLAWYGGPPAFGPRAKNIARNHDEAAFWSRYLEGALPWPAPEGPFVILGDANTDPLDGSGDPQAMLGLLSYPRLTDPQPKSPGGAAAVIAGKSGDPALDTTDWVGLKSVGDNLRVDYVLPSADLTVTDAGVFWPLPGDPMAETVALASPHRLVWVDVTLP